MSTNSRGEPTTGIRPDAGMTEFPLASNFTKSFVVVVPVKAGPRLRYPVPRLSDALQSRTRWDPGTCRKPPAGPVGAPPPFKSSWAEVPT